MVVVEMRPLGRWSLLSGLLERYSLLDGRYRKASVREVSFVGWISCSFKRIGEVCQLIGWLL